MRQIHKPQQAFQSRGNQTEQSYDKTLGVKNKL